MDLRVFAVLALVTVVTVSAQQRNQKNRKPTTYTTKFDYLNIEAILRNKRLTKSYYRCLVDQGPCTQEGAELRRRLPEALRTKCKNCSQMQKDNARKAISHVMKFKPDIWQGVVKKFDPTGELTKNILTDPNFLG